MVREETILQPATDESSRNVDDMKTGGERVTRRGYSADTSDTVQSARTQTQQIKLN